MQAIERDRIEQLSGGSQSLGEWLRELITGNESDEPDYWIYEEMNHNAQY